jgi:hypothetical protein
LDFSNKDPTTLYLLLNSEQMIAVAIATLRESGAFAEAGEKLGMDRRCVTKLSRAGETPSDSEPITISPQELRSSL